MTPKRRDLIDLMVRIAEGLAGVAAAIGVTVAALQYLDAQKTERASRTIELIDRWERPVFGALHAYRRLGEDFQVAFEAKGAEDLAKLSPEAAMDHLRQAALQRPFAAHDFDEVVYFFTRLSLCVEAEVCDAKTAKSFFEDTLTSFLENFGPTIKERQSLDKHFGEAVFSLQERMEKED